jgi:hypothetical protein
LGQPKSELWVSRKLAAVLERRVKLAAVPDSLSARYAELLSGSYDCLDRIVLNGYFRMGHNPGGFRTWWRALTGSEQTLDNTHLMRMAGRFSRRIHAYAKSQRYSTGALSGAAAQA